MATDSLSLVGKVAIVTGSGKENGIGAGIALALAKAGARVVINYVSESTALRAATVVGNIEKAAGKGSVVVVRADVSHAAGAQELVDGSLKALNVDHIDILVNNAGWASPGPALLQTAEAIEKTFAVGVYGPLHVIRSVVPHMPRGGRIINIGSVVSKLAIAGNPIYVAAKAATDALTFSLAQELGRDGKGLTINTVAPGPVMTDSLPPDSVPAQMLANWLVSQTRAENRPGTVDDIADAVLLLVSERSRWITGQFISVSGGITGG